MSFDKPDQETAPTPTMPMNDVLFVVIPPGGFSAANLQKYIRAGYSLWGIVPLEPPQTAGDLILPENLKAAPVNYLVLKLDVNHIPVNLLAFQIVKAKQDKGGLDQLTRVFFDLSLRALEDGLNKAKANVR